ncbi:beta-galactosidase/beta-glucuronidase [Galbibacter orientalis DSM 19592]|uniref:Beta-galactosidase/beta-glucuronidase n=1 Tax=Galbibacter orientalis DSM 19592 TaxID=926559 RepID=I3CAT6_9FLAO|nr:glycoside hydrolase family 2 TIM barrel-domain containing protein [Galbibacter orientalis]EIJ40729.1 beta-galactosidase/beta-glucuronidase [Galbibacter orientalis DSM 19592]
MKKEHIYLLIFIAAIIGVIMFLPWKSKAENKTSVSDFNFGWEFQKSLESTSFESLSAQEWRSVNLPHDWIVENDFDSTLVYNAKATGYLNGEGYGYYRKSFPTTVNKDEMCYVLFDGIYNNSEVYVNGAKLGIHPYGYSPFYYDITPFLNNVGSTNIMEVKVDHSRYADSRWYTGAGIYRNVQLITTSKLHIPVWGAYITTPTVTKQKAEVKIDVEVTNQFSTEKEFKLVTEIYDEEDIKVASVTEHSSINKQSDKSLIQQLLIEKPKLWSIDTPHLYKAETYIINDKDTVAVKRTTFGIRTISFDPKKGFFLNGENLKIKGVCLHHDAGLVGAAVPKGVWKRRLKILKEGGCNAIRISHNPASQEFLDLCDEMGLLVQDEMFDEWDNPKDKRFNQNEQDKDYVTRGYTEHFQEWAEKDLKAIIKSHRNHPSIIQWSIGNEIEWTYPRNASATGFFDNMSWKGNYFWSEPPFSPEEIKTQLETLPKGKYDIGQTAKKLSRWIKELDTTRPVTANLILPSASHLSGYTEALDVVGYSYRRVLYDYGHKNYPDKPIMGTENLGQYHEWKAVMERPFIAGTFLWTGIDYMGEIREPWPVRVSTSGLLNTAGFPRGSYYMFKSLWTEKPTIYIATQNIEKSLNTIDENGNIVPKDPEAWKKALWSWQKVNNHWNYNKGEIINVELYSNCKTVELFLDEKSLGKKHLSDFDDHIYKWAVPFSEGTLKAVGEKNGETIVESISTAASPSQIKLTVDKNQLKGDHYDVLHVVAQLLDSKGNPVKVDDRTLSFSVKGPAKILGVDSGWEKNIEKFQSNKSTTHNGKTLLIIQSQNKVGEIAITAEGKGLKSGETIIKIK